VQKGSGKTTVAYHVTKNMKGVLVVLVSETNTATTILTLSNDFNWQMLLLP